MPGMCLNRSSVIGPDGIALADRGRYWGVAVATLDLDRPRMVMRGGTTGLASFREDAWNHRRPDTYEELLDHTGTGQLIRPRSRLRGLLK